MIPLLQALLDGLVLGGVYAFAAVGFSLIFGVLGVLNVAHGSLYAIGAYMAATLGNWLVGQGWDPWWTLALAVSTTFGLVEMIPSAPSLWHANSHPASSAEIPLRSSRWNRSATNQTIISCNINFNSWISARI